MVGAFSCFRGWWSTARAGLGGWLPGPYGASGPTGGLVQVPCPKAPDAPALTQRRLPTPTRPPEFRGVCRCGPRTGRALAVLALAVQDVRGGCFDCAGAFGAGRPAVPPGWSRCDLVPPTGTDDGGQDAAPRVGAVRSHGAGDEGRREQRKEARHRERHRDSGAGDGLEKLGEGTGRLVHGVTSLLTWCPCPGVFQHRRGVFVGPIWSNTS